MTRFFRRLYDAFKGRVPVGGIGTELRVQDGVYVITHIHVRRTLYDVSSVQLDAVSLGDWHAMRRRVHDER